MPSEQDKENAAQLKREVEALRAKRDDPATPKADAGAGGEIEFPSGFCKDNSSEYSRAGPEPLHCSEN
jgi:hypothetical protein